MNESLETVEESDFATTGVQADLQYSTGETSSNVSIFHNFRIACTLSILSSCLEELSILKRMMKSPTKKKWENLVLYRNIDDRYGPHVVEEFDVVGLNFLTECQKFQKEICYIFTIVQSQYEALLKNGSEDIIFEAVHADEKLREDEEGLLFERDVNNETVEELKALYKKEKEFYLAHIRERKNQLFKVRDNFEDALIYGLYENRYVTAWESSRCYQKELISSQKENNYLQIISDTKTKIDHEDRVHMEIVTYIDANMDDMDVETKYWTKLYEQERERRDMELYNLKMAKENLIEELDKLKETTIQHKEQIDAWINLKESRKQAEIQEKKELAASIKIQRWWRGTMVRKKLGPYKKKRKGRKKGKK